MDKSTDISEDDVFGVADADTPADSETTEDEMPTFGELLEQREERGNVETAKEMLRCINAYGVAFSTNTSLPFFGWLAAIALGIGSLVTSGILSTVLFYGFYGAAIYLPVFTYWDAKGMNLVWTLDMYSYQHQYGDVLDHDFESLAEDETPLGTGSMAIGILLGMFPVGNVFVYPLYVFFLRASGTTKLTDKRAEIGAEIEELEKLAKAQEL